MTDRRAFAGVAACDVCKGIGDVCSKCGRTWLIPMPVHIKELVRKELESDQLQDLGNERRLYQAALVRSEKIENAADQVVASITHLASVIDLTGVSSQSVPTDIKSWRSLILAIVSVCVSGTKLAAALETKIDVK